MTRLFKMTAGIEVDQQTFSAGLLSAEKRFSTTAGRLASMSRTAGARIGAMASGLGPALAVLGGGAALKGLVDRAGQMADIAVSVGQATSTVTALSFAANQAGTRIDAVTQALAKLSASAQTGGAKKLESLLGTGASSFGSAKMTDQMLMLARALDKLPAEGRLAALMKAGLRVGDARQIMQMSGLGEGGLQTQFARGARIGSLADASDSLGDNVQKLKDSMTLLLSDSGLVQALAEIAEWAARQPKEPKNPEEKPPGINWKQWGANGAIWGAATAALVYAGAKAAAWGMKFAGVIGKTFGVIDKVLAPLSKWINGSWSSRALAGKAASRATVLGRLSVALATLPEGAASIAGLGQYLYTGGKNKSILNKTQDMGWGGIVKDGMGSIAVSSTEREGEYARRGSFNSSVNNFFGGTSLDKLDRNEEMRWRAQMAALREGNRQRAAMAGQAPSLY